MSYRDWTPPLEAEPDPFSLAAEDEEAMRIRRLFQHPWHPPPLPRKTLLETLAEYF
jgi:hypothetical protein